MRDPADHRRAGEELGAAEAHVRKQPAPGTVTGCSGQLRRSVEFPAAGAAGRGRVGRFVL